MKEEILEKDKQITTSTNVQKKKHVNQDDELFRVVINKESNEILEKLVRRTNDGFAGDKVTKSDVVCLMIANSAESFSEADIKALRQIHFDEKRALRALLKKAGDQGELPAEITRVLKEHLGLAEASKKRVVKNSIELSTGKNVESQPA